MRQEYKVASLPSSIRVPLPAHKYARHMHKALIRFLQTHQKITKYAMGSIGSFATIDMIIGQIVERIALRVAQEVKGKERQPEMSKPVTP